MENLRYTENEIQKGIKYMIDNNYLEECISYNFTIEDITNNKITCIDDFQLFNEDEDSEDNDINYEKNQKIKWELEKLIDITNCNDLSKYIYQLLNYIKNNM